MIIAIKKTKVVSIIEIFFLYVSINFTWNIK